MKKISIIIIVCCLSLSFAQQNHESGGDIVTGIPCGHFALTTGTACIIHSSDDLKKVKTGDIIVTMMTHESWAPSLKKSSGIITNLGDRSCHAAQYGTYHAIPVVVGAHNATEKIKDGHFIVMDCSQRALGRVYKPETTCNVTKPKLIMSMTPSGNDVSQNVLPTDQCLEITQVKGDIIAKTFNKHYKPFLSYVMKIKNDIGWRKWTGESGLFALARKVGRCGEFEIECIPLSYDFFDQDQKYIESIIKKIEMDYIDLLFEKYNQKPGDKEWLAHVLHTEHINKITLPQELNREKLAKHPKKYKKIMDQKKVDPLQRDVLIASGLFVRYCVENKVKIS